MFKSRVTKIAWIVTEKFGVVFLSILSFFIIAKYLTPEELGVGVFILGIMELFSFFFTSIVDSSFISVKNIEDKNNGTVFWSSLILSLITSVILVFGLSIYYSDSHLILMVIVASTYIPLQALSRVHIVHLRRAGQFKSLAQRSIFGKVVGMLVAIALAIYGFGTWALIAQAVIMSLVSSVTVLIAYKVKIPFNIELPFLYRLVAIGLPASAKAFSSMSLLRGLVVMIETTLGSAQLGYFNFASRLVQLPRDAINGVILGYAYPVISNRKNSGADIDVFFLQATKFSLYAVLPLFFGFAVLAEPVVGLFFEDKWLPSIFLTHILALVTAASLYSLLIPSYLVATQNTFRGLKGEIIGSVLAFICYLFLYQKFDILAAVIALIVRLIVVLPVNISVMLRVSSIKLTTLLHVFIKPTLCSLAMYLTILALPLVFELSLSVRIVLSLALGAFIYIAMCLLIEKSLFIDFKRFLKSG